MKRLLTAAALSGALLLSTTSATAQPPGGDTYGDYTRMFERSAGQFWRATAARGQWAWHPVSGTESHISWGQPSNWPPDYKERFILDGDWVLLDGWWGNGTYYKLNIVAQWVANDCTVRAPLPPGALHYAKWQVPPVGESYCLFAHGTILEESSGKLIAFTHEQRWTNMGDTTNPHLGAAPTLRQTEKWWDDNGHPFRLVLHRDVYLAKGHGMAWRIDDYDPTTGAKIDGSDLKYTWTW